MASQCVRMIDPRSRGPPVCSAPRRRQASPQWVGKVVADRTGKKGGRPGILVKGGKLCQRGGSRSFEERPPGDDADHALDVAPGQQVAAGREGRTPVSAAVV